MAHKHDHHDETYYLDQLCMIALCGAFAAIALALYFWQRPMLTLMVGKQFHEFVLWSGIALLVMVVTRAVVLWISVGRTQPAGHTHDHHHHHEHGPGCNHDHDHHHEHAHEHAHAVQVGATAAAGPTTPHQHAVQPEGQGVGLGLPLVAAHSHAEPHSHAHDHGHDHGHSHDFAPWRYMVLLVPVVLFLLGLPNKPPTVKDVHHGDLSAEATRQGALSAGTVLSAGPMVLDNVVLVAAVAGQRSLGKAKDIDFKTLEAAAYTPDERDYWRGRVVSVRGQFAPVARSNRVFTLVRLKINCCAADAIQLNVPIVSEEPLKDLDRGQWIKVTGRIDFRAEPGTSRYMTILRLPDQSYIVPVDPDPDPYIQ
jgi:hypothetical protein